MPNDNDYSHQEAKGTPMNGTNHAHMRCSPLNLEGDGEAAFFFHPCSGRGFVLNGAANANLNEYLFKTKKYLPYDWQGIAAQCDDCFQWLIDPKNGANVMAPHDDAAILSISAADLATASGVYAQSATGTAWVTWIPPLTAADLSQIIQKSNPLPLAHARGGTLTLGAKDGCGLLQNVSTADVYLLNATASKAAEKDFADLYPGGWDRIEFYSRDLFSRLDGKLTPLGKFDPAGDDASIVKFSAKDVKEVSMTFSWCCFRGTDDWPIQRVPARRDVR